MLKTRILTALLLLPVVLACLFLGPPTVWGSFALIALAVSGWEWTRFARFDRSEMVVFLLGFVALGLAWLFLPLARSWSVLFDGFSLVFWLILAPLWLRHKWTLRHKWLAALVGWMLLLSALAAVTRFRELQFPQMKQYGGPLALLFVLAIAWVADIAAYFAGRAFGRKKLAPGISPGKTWEGVYGALIAVALYGWILRQAGMPIFEAVPLWLLFPLGASLTAVSVTGDLLESLLKRQVGMKDSSNLLPGHGGVLDRIDSLLALAPVSSALLYAYALLVYRTFS